MKPPHKCDERCICPVDGTPMFYAPAVDDHACQDIDCKYGHGFNAVRMQEILDLLDRPRRRIETVKVRPGLL